MLRRGNQGMADLNERVAKVEQRLEHAEEDIEDTKKDVKTLMSYSNLVRGIIIAATAAGGVLGSIISLFWRK